jgi:hypothetical protein
LYFKVESEIVNQAYYYSVVYSVYQEDYCKLHLTTQKEAQDFILSNIRDTDVVDYIDKYKHEKQLLTGEKFKEICRTWNT